MIKIPRKTSCLQELKLYLFRQLDQDKPHTKDTDPLRKVGVSITIRRDNRKLQNIEKKTIHTTIRWTFTKNTISHSNLWLKKEDIPIIYQNRGKYLTRQERVPGCYRRDRNSTLRSIDPDVDLREERPPCYYQRFSTFLP